MSTDFVFTSSSVTCGHPDKLCDCISDAIIDRFLMQNPASRVETECAVSGGVLFIACRSRTEASVDLADTARQVVARCGYRRGAFNADHCSVMISQSEYHRAAAPRIDLATLDETQAGRIPASHQVTLFGYACRQSATLMPLPVALAHAMAQRLDARIADRSLEGLAPDAQVQVGVIYSDRHPVGIHSVTLIASQHEAERPSVARLRDALMQAVVEPVLGETDLPANPDLQIAVNPEGPVIGGGPTMHSGLTGRKIGIDTYGEYARQTGTALSGKDPLRIERIGTYAARHAAKQVVAAGLAEECEIQLSYAIGLAVPVGVRAHAYGTGQLDDDELTRLVSRVFDFRPGMMCKRFGLQTLPQERDGFFKALAVYGQLGRADLDLPWERLDQLDALQSSA